MTDKELFGNSEQLESCYEKDHVADPGNMVGDCISRQAAIDEIKAVYEWHDIPTEERMIQHFKVLPSAQQEIVACGDCIHWVCHDRRCGYWNHGVKPLDWCCHAERRTDGRPDKQTGNADVDHN